MRRLAKIVSAVLNPFVVIAVTPFIFFSFRWGIITLAFVLSMSGVIWFLVRRKIFSNFDVSLKEQRPLLFTLEISAMLIYLVIIYFAHAPKILLLGTLSTVFIITALLALSGLIKASGHMAILSGAVSMLTFVYGPVYLLGFVLVGVMAWSRVKLKRHTIKEVIVGLAIGVVTSIFISLIGL